MIKIAFIGGGNMATSIVGGLIAKGFEANAIAVGDPLAENRERLNKDFAVVTNSDNKKVVNNANVIVFAVKPQVMQTVCEAVAADIPADALIISIAAGTTIENLSNWLNQPYAMVRCMPNTPALVQLGATGAYANSKVSAEQKSIAESILEAVGIVEWLDEESQLDSVTAVSGSAPAYFFLMLEAMVSAAIDQGLPANVARNLAVQTCVGAGKLAQSDTVDLAELRRRVTSPGGTTEKAIASMQSANFEKIVKEAMDACRDRSVELAQ